MLGNYLLVNFSIFRKGLLIDLFSDDNPLWKYSLRALERENEYINICETDYYYNKENIKIYLNSYFLLAFTIYSLINA